MPASLTKWRKEIEEYFFFLDIFCSLAGIKKPVDQYGPAGGAAPAAPAQNGADDDDDDFDLFGSDDEDEEEVGF